MTAPREVCMGTGFRRVALGRFEGSAYRKYARPRWITPLPPIMDEFTWCGIGFALALTGVPMVEKYSEYRQRMERLYAMRC